MAVSGIVTLRTLVRRRPVEAALFVLGPVALGVVQLLNGYYHEVPIAASAAFAGVMVAHAVLYAQYTVTRVRLEDLEATAVR